MQRPPFTSRDLACLHIAQQRAEGTRPSASPPPSVRKRGTLAVLMKLLRRGWNWIEQPEAPAPASRPVAAHFYTQL
jgi:hypothetical protein